jgi:4'-phosphopantetheinyl transferase
VELGCDLELIEPRSDAFVADYFTSEEQALVAEAPAAERSRLLALLWSGKESVLKALREGLRLDLRCVSVRLDAAPQGENEAVGLEDPALAFQPHGPAGWRPLHVRYAGGRIFHGWWQCTATRLRTLVAAPPPRPPVLLKIPTDHAVVPVP